MLCSAGGREAIGENNQIFKCIQDTNYLRHNA